MDQTLPPIPPIPVNKAQKNPSKRLLIIGVILILLIATGLFFFFKIRPSLNSLQQIPTDNAFSSSLPSATAIAQPVILSVTIDSISDNILQVTATPPAVAEKKQYKVLISNKTEILRSRIYDDSSKPVTEDKLNISSLESGKQIVIYTTSDIDSSAQLDVFKIEVFPKAP